MNVSMSIVGAQWVKENGEKRYDPAQGVRDCAAAGFRYLDFDLSNAAKNGGPMSRDDFPAWCREMRRVLDECGVTVQQTHGHWCWPSVMPTQEERDRNWQMTLRSVEATSFLGNRPWMVTHPISVFDAEGYNREKSVELGYRQYSELGELGKKYGTRIAAEHLFVIANKNGYCCGVEDLLGLMEKLDDPELFGICWDFGHANRQGVDQAAGLRMAAPYLRATHVHDNNAKSDNHVFPYCGNIAWEELLPILGEIGYAGTLNLEVHVLQQRLPASLRMETLRYMHTVVTEMAAQTGI